MRNVSRFLLPVWAGPRGATGVGAPGHPCLNVMCAEEAVATPEPRRGCFLAKN